MGACVRVCTGVRVYFLSLSLSRFIVNMHVCKCVKMATMTFVQEIRALANERHHLVSGLSVCERGAGRGRVDPCFCFFFTVVFFCTCVMCVVRV